MSPFRAALWLFLLSHSIFPLVGLIVNAIVSPSIYLSYDAQIDVIVWWKWTAREWQNVL